MRLLRAKSDNTFELTTFTHAPPYAILSHRWTSEEVDYQDILNRTGQNKAGYRKLEFCAAQAKQDGLEYFWCDTCCIDKTDTVELSRSITSMYRLYAESKHCYVYLTDVGDDMTASEWFRRGWTLQELLAPSSVKFFNKHTYLGTKHDLADSIEQATGIPEDALLGRRPLDDYGARQRFSWRAERNTTEPEDGAYCLLGIFDVSMPPLYGEGEAKAFGRLKESISRKFDVDLMQIETTFEAAIRSSVTRSRSEPFKNEHKLSAAELAVRRTTIMKNLEFKAMDNRRAVIDLPMERTCGWVLEHPVYVQWQACSSFLWIKAHPGAGKSTLMKFLDYQLSSELTYGVLVSFYFNARGELLERTVKGLYRSLITQLLSLPGLDRVLDTLTFRRRAIPAADFFDEPPMAVLRELLIALFVELESKYDRVYCLVDALDEGDEEEVLEMVEFLRHVESSRLSVCFASRHYPTLDLPIQAQIVLDHEPGHQHDIELYLETRLRVRHNPELLQEVVRKANGIFMWVVLVTAILNRERRHGSIFEVRQKLDQIPGRLLDLLREIAQRDDVPSEQFFRCIQWILYAERSMSLVEFFHAMMPTMSLEHKITVNDETCYKITATDMEHHLVTSSKGLAEVVAGQVQFIHESIRDFFLDYNGLRTLFPEVSLTAEDCHAMLARHCWESFTVGWHHTIPLVGNMKGAVKYMAIEHELQLIHPLFGYSVAFLVSHLRQSMNVALQNKICSELPDYEWCRWRKANRLRDHPVGDRGARSFLPDDDSPSLSHVVPYIPNSNEEDVRNLYLYRSTVESTTPNIENIESKLTYRLGKNNYRDFRRFAADILH